jgi:hypothetical protein
VSAAPLPSAADLTPPAGEEGRGDPAEAADEAPAATLLPGPVAPLGPAPLEPVATGIAWRPERAGALCALELTPPCAAVEPIALPGAPPARLAPSPLPLARVPMPPLWEPSTRSKCSKTRSIDQRFRGSFSRHPSSSDRHGSRTKPGTSTGFSM